MYNKKIKNMEEQSMKGKTRSYEEEFKRHAVAQVASGKRAAEVARLLNVSKTSVNTWVRNYGNSGSFRAADNISPLEREVKFLQKENKRLEMENDILKQAALIMARK